jgi:ArsR family transcriptional regulator
VHEPNPFEQYITMLKVLSDDTRLKIIWLLCTIDSKASVAEIMDVLGETHFNVLRHFKILKSAGLVFKRKEGKCIFYFYRSANDIFSEYVRAAIASIPLDLMEQEVIRCKQCLSMRMDRKCIIGYDSEETLIN